MSPEQDGSLVIKRCRKAVSRGARGFARPGVSSTIEFDYELWVLGSSDTPLVRDDLENKGAMWHAHQRERKKGFPKGLRVALENVFQGDLTHVKLYGQATEGYSDKDNPIPEGARAASARRSGPRGAAAGAARIFRGGMSRRRRGCRADMPRRRVAPAPRVPRGYAAMASRRGRDVDIQRGRVAATPRPRRGYSVGRVAAAATWGGRVPAASRVEGFWTRRRRPRGFSDT